MKVKTARVLKKLLNGSMKIFQVDLQKAKDNIKNKIEGYSVLPSFRPVPVSGQKKVNSVIFDGILTLRPLKQSVRKTNISAIN